MDPNRVFINCPFDDRYKEIFDALVFAIHDCGMEARHALIDDSIAIRLMRIVAEIRGAKYSVHDISRVEVGRGAHLPRFNMPFEAGIGYLLHELSDPADKHHILILDAKPYRYQASLSDVAGLDPKIHDGKPEIAIEALRTFLVAKGALPAGGAGAAHIWARYQLFLAFLMDAAPRNNIRLDELAKWSGVKDLQALMIEWIFANPP